MREGQGTRLPEPARDLWLRTREIIRDNLRGLQEAPVEYRLGGGTILAARWSHRESADIDITVDDGTPLFRLGDPIQSGFEEQVKTLGGEPRFVPELNKYKILFDEGDIDIWARAPMLREGHRHELVEGRQEVLLSNAQILRGKIERGDLNLARDVYDVVRAAELDPASLEAAVNAIPRQAAEAMAFNWHWSGPSLAADAARNLRGVPPDELAEARTLGHRAATAARQALYDELRIRTADRTVIVETTTVGGRRRRLVMEPPALDARFEADGINGHLKMKGPGADAIREYSAQLCRLRSDDCLIYQENGDRPTHWRTATRAMNLPLLRDRKQDAKPT